MAREFDDGQSYCIKLINYLLKLLRTSIAMPLSTSQVFIKMSADCCLGSGVQHKPGVYLSGSRTPAAVHDSNDSSSNNSKSWMPAANGASALAATAAAAASSGQDNSRPLGQAHLHATSANKRTASPVQAAPLMHAGKPASLGVRKAAAVGSAAQPIEDQRHTVHHNLHSNASSTATGAEAAALTGVAASGSGSRAASAAAQGRLSTSGRSQAFDVYGQPRVVKPQLPAAYSKVSWDMS
jgi:hypothetical protein